MKQIFKDVALAVLLLVWVWAMFHLAAAMEAYMYYETTNPYEKVEQVIPCGTARKDRFNSTVRCIA